MVFSDHTFLLFYIFFQFKLERTDLLALVCFFYCIFVSKTKKVPPWVTHILYMLFKRTVNLVCNRKA